MKKNNFKFGFTKDKDLYFNTANKPWGKEGPYDWAITIQNTQGHHGIMSFTSIDNAHLFRVTVDPSEITEEEAGNWLKSLGLEIDGFRNKR
jgi:hypothetical protein